MNREIELHYAERNRSGLIDRSWCGDRDSDVEQSQRTPSLHYTGYIVQTVCQLSVGRALPMQKYGHIGTFPMGETGPHIAILVLSVVPHFNSMVYSKIWTSSASVGDCGVVWDDPGEPPRI